MFPPRYRRASATARDNEQQRPHDTLPIPHRKESRHAFIAILAVLVLTPGAALSRENCDTEARVSAWLSIQRGSTIIETAPYLTRATRRPGAALRLDLWANEEAGTWTITATNNGRMCVITGGGGQVGTRDLFDLLWPGTVRG